MIQQWKSYLLWILLAEGTGIVSAIISARGMELYNAQVQQPLLAPPGVLFPIVWSILYALMGIGAARVSLTPPSKNRSRGLNLFILQLIVNFFWSPIFFQARAFGFAFLWLMLLWILVLLMIQGFRKTDRSAANLQIPYLIWLTFAGYLNLAVWNLNR